MCGVCGCGTINTQKGAKGDPGTNGTNGTNGEPYVPIIDGQTATIGLSEIQSGSVVYFDRPAGVTVTLPDSPTAGTNYTFEPLQNPSGGSYVVNTGGAGIDEIDGFAYMNVSGAFPAKYIADAASQISMNGTTTGGSIGTSFKVIYDGTNKWIVSGYISGSGAIATPFS